MKTSDDPRPIEPENSILEDPSANSGVRIRTITSVSDLRTAADSFAKSRDFEAAHETTSWLAALCDGLGYRPYLLMASRNNTVTGLLPLAFVRSSLFGRFLISLPFIDSAGLVGDDRAGSAALIDRAVTLADALDVKYLELRHEVRHEHPALTEELTSKVHMRLALPRSADELMTRFKSKLRSQLRNGEKRQLTVDWGGMDLLDDFYDVLSRNMRGLGTPVYGRPLFRSILEHFLNRAELCVVRAQERPLAAALVVHRSAATQVPCAGSIKEFNSTNANMVMYWQLLKRAIEKKQRTFDFGRCTRDGPHYRFKEQWGASAHPAVWQYYVRRGSINDIRPESSKYRLGIRIWQRLPLCLTRWLGPGIVRGIPS